MSKRATWEFEYPAEMLLRAAQDRASYHKARHDAWAKELIAAEQVLRDQAVQLREQPVTGGSRIDVVVDPTLKARYDEVRQKCDQHQRLVAEYNGWARVFALNPHARLALNADDVLFFGVGQPDTEP